MIQSSSDNYCLCIMEQSVTHNISLSIITYHNWLIPCTLPFPPLKKLFTPVITHKLYQLIINTP